LYQKLINFTALKKVAVILLFLVYGSASVGATVHLHYCMNELSGWSLASHEGEKCGKCGMKGPIKDGCCKDEQKHFKLNTDHQKADVAQFLNLLLAPAESFHNGFLAAPLYFKIAESFPITHAPPGCPALRLHVLYNVFLI